MRNTTPKTPLLAILRALENDDRRKEFADAAQTSVGYLYQLAGCYPGRKTCRTDLAKRIADASAAMTKKYGTPKITMEQIAVMCAECEK